MKTVMANEVDGDMGNEWLKTNSAGTGAYVLKSLQAERRLCARGASGLLARRCQDGQESSCSTCPKARPSGCCWKKATSTSPATLTPVDVEGMAGNADVKIQRTWAGRSTTSSFNQKNESYKNPKFLDAMRWAIDYQGMADTILKGPSVVHQTFLPEGFLGALDETPYSLDVEKAKALMAESGDRRSKITLYGAQRRDRMDMAQSIQNTFGQVGITVELDVGDGAEQLEEYRARQHDAHAADLGPGLSRPAHQRLDLCREPRQLATRRATPAIWPGATPMIRVR